MSKPAHPLQRHRRRSSTPTSPISPSVGRRTFERTHKYFDTISPADAFSATTHGSESPSLDIRVPSPTFDLPTFFPASTPIKATAIERLNADRSSEEFPRHGQKSLDTTHRPSTSGGGSGGGGQEHDPERILPSQPAISPFPAYKSPPTTSLQSPYQETDRYLENRSRFYENSGANARNYSTTSFAAERGLYEDVHGRNAASKKSRLNLLNPMSLLAKRRSSQNQSKLEEVPVNIKSPRVPDIPEDFEPSIRGKIVHDFSAPRTRRINSQNDIPAPENVPYNAALSPQPGHLGQPEARSPNPSSSHSPLFKEHFQDDRLALQPARTNYLHSLITEAHSNAPNLDHVPAFARRLPTSIPERISNSREPLINLHIPAGERPFPKRPESLPPPPPPKESPSEEPPSPKLNLPPVSALPKHMMSTSSRFSFQIGGQASLAQERLLEARHKEHDAEKRPLSIGKVSEVGDDDYGEYDFSEDDGLEERIPGVNADYDEEDVMYHLPEAHHTPQLRHQTGLNTDPANDQDGLSLPALHITQPPQSLVFSPRTTHQISKPTHREVDGFAIGFEDMTHTQDQGSLQTASSVDGGTNDVMFYDGLGISTYQQENRVEESNAFTDQHAFDENDLYFDDGELGGAFDDDVREKFDEDIFDDESGRIRDIPAENARKLEAARQAAGVNGQVRLTDHEQYHTHEDVSHDLEPVGTDALDDSPSGLVFEHGDRSSSTSEVAHLTEGNLAAYHDALALAATEAAAAGKFDRQVSFTELSEGTTSLSHSHRDSSQAGRVSEEGIHSFGMPSSGIAEDDGFPFDNDLDDDLMIAEANAEALANDDEGIYGQEFGFYARSHGKETAQMVNGGYFTSRGSNGIKRSHSAKANFQEPSLTPITERSEWSTRNSIASLQIPALPGSAQSLPSPGIAQLLEQDLSGYEDELTFSALMKLRRGAFGGSSTSVNTQNLTPAGSSPLAHMSSYSFPASVNLSNAATSHLHTLSALNGTLKEESDNDDDDEYDGLTLTQNTPRKPVVFSQLVAPSDIGALSSPIVASERRRGHSRNSSGAESVSYVMNGDGRWVLERRRTGNSGEIEVVGREYLAGGRI